jgi:hypothetical protein
MADFLGLSFGRENMGTNLVVLMDSDQWQSQGAKVCHG